MSGWCQLPVVGNEEVGWEWDEVKGVEEVGLGLIRGILKRLGNILMHLGRRPL